MEKVPLAKCDSCPLKTYALVPPRGPAGTASIVFIGEAPGHDEVRLNKVFIGRSGELLRRCLDAYHLTDVAWITNACMCYVPDVAMKEEGSACCRDRLIAEIKSKSPKIVVTLGNIPTHAILGGAITGISIRRGKIVESAELGTKVLPTYHPAAILRSADLYPDFTADLQKATREVTGEAAAEAVQEERPAAEATMDFAKAFAAAERSPYAILDLETSGFRYGEDKILCVVLGTIEGIFVIMQEAVYDPEFAKALQACKTKWVGHGSKFDRAFLKAQLGVSIEFAFDTQLAGYALDERKGTHDLKVICARLFDAPDWEGDITKYLTKPKTDSYSLLPKGVLYRYAAYDGWYTRRLTDVLAKRIGKAPAQLRLVREILMPASTALADIEVRGIRIDLEKAEVTARLWNTELVQLEGQIEKIVGYRMNLASTRQVAVYLFDILGLPTLDGRSTDKEVLARLAGRFDHPVLKSLVHHRHLSKLLGTYIEGAQQRVDPYGRLHTNFLLFGTVTGRLSSRDPNLQNLPSDPDDPYGNQIRNLYIASEGMSLVYLDYSQAELRVLATLSEDPFLVEVYQGNRDLHNETSIELFGPNYTSRQRFFAKTVNFGLPYGRTARALAKDANLPGLSQQLAEEFITRYFERIPGVVRWTEGIKRLVRAQGYVESKTGRRRRFPLRTDDIILEVERQAINFLCQSGASDITLKSLITIHNELAGKAHILLTVHDSILLECPIENVEEVAQRGKAIMAQVAEGIWGPLVPFKASSEVGERWGSLKEVGK